MGHTAVLYQNTASPTPRRMGPVWFWYSSILALIVDGRHALVHALVEGIAVELVFGKAVRIAHGHQVLAPELQRRHADGLADVVNMALSGEHGLGDAVAPHGAGRGTVGKHGPAVALQVVAGIELGERAHTLGHHAVAVGGVGALVGERLELPGHQGAVRPDLGDDMGPDGVTDAVGDEGLLPGTLQLDQPPAHLGRAPGAKGLIQRVLLIAEAAADVRLDDADLAPGDAQGLAHHPADDVGDLGGGDHHDPSRLLIGKAAVVFNVAVLHRRRIVPALHLDEARLLAALA